MSTTKHITSSQKIALFTDSSSGITELEVNQYQIKVLPLFLIFDEWESLSDYNTFLTSKIISEEEFIRRINVQKQTVKTSQTPIGIIKKGWEEALIKNDKILFIPISKGLSSQFQTSLPLSLETEFMNRVTVFDSKGIAIINKIMLLTAQLAINSGKSMEQILIKLTEIKNNYFSLIVPYDLKMFVQGGRISNWTGRIGDFLKIKLLLQFNETINLIKKHKKFEKTIKEALSIIEHHFKKQQIQSVVLCILTGCAEQTIIDSVLEIVKRYHFSKIIIESLPLVVCAHTGINTFAFVGFPQDTIIDVLPLLNVLKK